MRHAGSASYTSRFGPSASESELIAEATPELLLCSGSLNEGVTNKRTIVIHIPDVDHHYTDMLDDAIQVESMVLSRECVLPVVGTVST